MVNKLIIIIFIPSTTCLTLSGNLDLFLVLFDVHSAFIYKGKILTIEKRVCDLFEDVPRPRAFSSCGRVQGFPLSFRRDRQVRNATLPTLNNGVNIDRAFRFCVRRETTRSGSEICSVSQGILGACLALKRSSKKS